VGRASRRRAEQRRVSGAGGPAAPTSATSVVAGRSPAAERLASASVTVRGTVGLLRLADLHAERVRLDDEVSVLVQELAASGVSWGVIGRALGISRQGARQRYG